ncbi:MAG: FtsX-like permease family protein, partial [Eubacterium sp.]|nr:FtsX-like permease family protein [Eubacterium sp.]
QIAGNLFAGIFGVLGLLNLANVMIASAVSRQKEFAVMQSIGMTKRQLQRLFLFEGAGYVAMASLAGCLVSAVISKTAIRSLAEHLWYCSYRFQMMPAVAITVPYFAGAVLISVFVHKIWNQDSVVEKLRKAV